ncbi:lactate racemase domain-containing protein [Candidatus Omnitrophota bacterium]
MKTIIAVPDFTRKAHLSRVLPQLLKKISGEDIEIILATGLHHPPTRQEIKRNLGNIPGEIKISVHNYKKGSVMYFGKTKQNVPVYLNKKLKTAASVITVGVVEPHLYAGYSGGTKVVAIGLAGEKTINFTHHPRFLDNTGTSICSIKNNPFRDFIKEAASFIPVKYSINIVNDEKGNLLKIFEGDPGSSYKKAVDYSKKIFEKKINQSFDIIICDIPHTKAVNIYQASRAFNYIANTRKNVLNENALVLVKAGLLEGFGKGLGEKRFKNKMLSMKNPKKTLSGIKKRGCLAGEHRAYMVLKAMTKARLGFISQKSSLYNTRGVPFLFFKNLKEANYFIKKTYGKLPQILYLKNAFTSILVKN